MGAKDRRRLIALLLVGAVVLLGAGTLAARNLWDAHALCRYMGSVDSARQM